MARPDVLRRENPQNGTRAVLSRLCHWIAPYSAGGDTMAPPAEKTRPGLGKADPLATRVGSCHRGVRNCSTSWVIARRSALIPFEKLYGLSRHRSLLGCVSFG